MTSQASLRMFPILNGETQRKLLENETKQLAEAAIFPPTAADLLQGTIDLRDCGKGPFYLVTLQL